jgi:hypothetical protein
MRTFTVAEIAERIARKGEKLELVADRIRNWTKDGLLEPIGEKNPGTGRSRLYPEKALIEATVLLELMDCLGVQPIKARLYAGWFKAAKAAIERHAQQKEFLVFSRGPDGAAITLVDTKTLKELPAVLQRSKFASHIIIDLGALYARLDEKPETA